MAWDTTKAVGDTLTNVEYNDHVTDQKGHKTRHQAGGTDEISLSGMAGHEEIATIPLSFELNEQTATKIYFNKKVTINKIRSIVMKALAAVDNGTVQGANSTGNSANGLITHLASAALDDEQSVSPTTNNVVAADSYYKLTSAKTTSGGKILVTLEYTDTT